MKKITQILFFIFCLNLSAQTISTGVVLLSDIGGVQYSTQIDVTDALISLTLIGPEDSWLGIGFDAMSMTDGKDVVIYDGTTLTDRHFVGIGTIPPLDEATQDWTLTSNTVDTGVRTLVATRVRETGDPEDFVPRTSDTTIDLVWARSGSDDFILAWHQGNKGITTETFATLSNEEFQLSDFTISPNPAKNTMNITMPNSDEDLKLEVFDVLGKRVYKGVITNLQSSVNVSNWRSGVYLVRVSNDKITQTKRFIKQ
ncbi:T9SS type A sorting domain-containing protein [Winogradskyella sp. UBA3174]|uniref:T9SS type A sorting domain-containing protein n=1 Tax=Winogradskyella sp. UBA3174 TaxID=1947785 RepID=UPI0025D46880|nr:T9SS type A sorting domain-containing protein [Winogradskyella sp. UBA3174]|tara:strand:+ start:20937 stop:21704 length:768 start_codon:yes stop_codon:yes gene_type:complete